MTFFDRDKSGAGAPLGTFLKGLKYIKESIYVLYLNSFQFPR